MAKENNKVFSLDIRMDDLPPQRVIIQGKTLLGKSSSADICLEGHGLASKHLIFRLNHNSLQVMVMGPDVSIGGQLVDKGSSRILDKGDKINLNDIEIIIREDEQDESTNFDAPTTITNIQKYKEMLDGTSDEDSDRAPKSFMQKIKAKFKKNEKKEKVNQQVEALKKKGSEKKFQKLVSKGISIGQEPAPGFLRPIAFLADSSLAYALYQNLYQDLLAIHVQPTILKISSMVPVDKLMEIPILQDILKEILVRINLQNILAYLICFVLMHLLSSLLLGTTPSMALAGVSLNGNLVSKRIKSSIISILRPLQFILFPLDILTLVGKSSFFEFILRTRLHATSRTLSLVAALTLLPTLTCIALLSVMFKDISTLERQIVLEENAITNKESTIKSSHIVSKYFGINFNAPLEEDMRLVPTHQENDWTLTFYDRSKQTYVTIAKQKHLSPKTTLAIIKNGNPLFDLFFSELNAQMDTFQDESISSSEYQILFEQIRLALNLSMPNLVDTIMKTGPFINGLIDVRLWMQKQLYFTQMPDIRYVKNDKIDYLYAIPHELDSLNQSVLISFNGAIPTLKFSYTKGATILMAFIDKNIIPKLSRVIEEKELLETPPQVRIIDMIENKTLDVKTLDATIQFFKNEFKKVDTNSEKKYINTLKESQMFIAKKLNDAFGADKKFTKAIKQFETL